MMRRNRIQEHFDSYRRGVIPSDAPLVQITECRRAFYAGAQALMAIVFMDLSPGDGVEAADERLMIDLAEEIKDFVRREIATGLGSR